MKIRGIMNRRHSYDDPEVDLTGFTIKNLTEWNVDWWTCTVNYPEDKGRVNFDDDINAITIDEQYPKTVRLGVNATNRDNAINMIKQRVTEQLIKDNAQALIQTENATRRGLEEDIKL